MKSLKNGIKLGSLVGEINSFLAPKVTQELNDWCSKLDKKSDLTEGEAQKFINEHLEKRWDNHWKLVDKTHEEVKNFNNNYTKHREKLVETYGEHHEHISNYDKEVAQRAETLKNKVGELSAHTKKIQKVVKKSNAVKAQGSFSSREEDLDEMIERLNLCEQKLARSNTNIRASVNNREGEKNYITKGSENKANVIPPPLDENALRQVKFLKKKLFNKDASMRSTVLPPTIKPPNKDGRGR